MRQKSAEGIVSRRVERPRAERVRFGEAFVSLVERGAEAMVERPRWQGAKGGGTAWKLSAAPQATTASSEIFVQKPQMTMEEVLRRENLLKTQLGLLSLVQEHRRLQCQT